MSISREEFFARTEIELDLRASKVRNWLLEFLSMNKDKAYTISELAGMIPKDRLKKNAKHVDSAVNSAMTKLIANGLVTRKGSYFIRNEKQHMQKPEGAFKLSKTKIKVEKK